MENIDDYQNVGEQLEDLQYRGYKILQKKHGFRFGLDAVLLSHFATVKRGAKVLDLGTGTGIIPILLGAKTEAERIFGLEIQEEMVDMAKRSVLLNNLQDKVEIVLGDIKVASSLFGKASFDEVVSNPPYFSVGKGILCDSDKYTCARHEVLCSLEDVIRESSLLLCPGGSLTLVHRPFRLPDIITLLRKYKLEPKFLQMVQPNSKKSPNLVLIKSFKDGGAEMKVLPTLMVFDNEDRYTDEIEQIYNRG